MLAREVIADTMVFDAAKRCGCAACGADCVVPGYVINKVGTVSLAQASREAGIPLHSLAASNKLVGVDISDPVLGKRQSDGYLVRSQIFEKVPVRRTTDLVTELCALGPREIVFPKGPFPLLDGRSR